MEAFFHYLSTHPIAAITVAVIILFMTYLVIKKLLKIALILGLVLIAVSGYFYYKAPEKFPDNMKSVVEEVKDQSEKMAEQGKNVVHAGKEVLEKGKALAEAVGEKVKKEAELGTKK
ncbi:MAG: hypothetical protein JW736_05605 [Deltaproteobacteria bacterium]|nr:hypothetical protein [Deltaproteobacteria bacterium]MBN2687780.1 hypothetical protein [Deltaproteobacteria bacterium]